ncbi:hypothetical protein DSLPV1_101 [Dishui lake phycodnavirus 1]|uniref:hypothetical protein n=1 Tax=Dishui lake phycodnavirus 1 TaxID=2079134 RepID=UPI000CD6B6F6|nr:hypothetical protein C5Y57_gp101 [Dishui lake phycodnavirus 1]AUT19072.1 hypothetical protein DSLPV1_101 [Dishui lake phycodnavirus 1]
MLLIGAAVVVVIVVVVLIFLFWSGGEEKEDKKSGGEKKGVEEGKEKRWEKDGNILKITNDALERSSDSDGTRENYLIVPDVRNCHKDEPDEWCSEMKYNKDADGLAFIYDIEVGANPPPVGECPGGGYACAFIERYDAEGTLIGISNDSGQQLLDKMANDAWEGRWDDWQQIKQIDSWLKWENNKMIVTKEQSNPDGVGLNVGDEFTVDIARRMGATSMYFIFLLYLMKKAGETKPERIVLEIRNAQSGFKERLSQNNQQQQPPSSDNKSADFAEGEYKLTSTMPNGTEGDCYITGNMMRCLTSDDSYPALNFRFQRESGGKFTIWQNNKKCVSRIKSGLSMLSCVENIEEGDLETFEIVDPQPGNPTKFKLLNASQKYCGDSGDVGNWRRIACDIENKDDAPFFSAKGA